MKLRVRDDGGAVAVVVAVFAVVIFGFAAIIVDLGYARAEKARAQDAADSAALAAAAALYASGSPDFVAAVAAAKNNARDVLGRASGGAWDAAWSGCVDNAPLPIDVGCVSFDTTEINNPRQVRVAVPVTPVDSFFGGVFGYGGADVSASAVASLGDVTFAPACAICVLGGGPHLVEGNQVRANNADISFNGDVQLGTTTVVRAVQRTVFLGGVPLSPITGFRDRLETNATQVIDPLGGEPEPDDPPPPPPVDDDPLNPPPPPPLPPGPPRVNPCDPDPAIGGPGVYGSVELAGTCTLAPGTYVFTGDLTAAAGANIVGATRVQVWMRCGTVTAPRDCAADEPSGSIDLSAASSLVLRSRVGESVVYARPGPTTIELFGASAVTIRGHINAPNGTMVGGPCGGSNMNGLIVVSDLDVPSGRCLVSGATTARITEDPEPPVLIR